MNFYVLIVGIPPEFRESLKNNPEKFPAGYLIELTQKEWDLLKSKISTSTKGGKVKLPTAFTERGLYVTARN